MPSTLPTVVLLASLISSVVSIPSKYDFSKINARDIINRDVVIVGGGSGGIHAAFGIKDSGKSIVVIETKNSIGGHTETVRDSNGNTAEAGVNVFHYEPEVFRYFGRFNVPLMNLSANYFSANSFPYDFRTGQAIPVAAIQQPSQQAIGLAFQKFFGFLAKYPELDRGMFLPNPVPDELVMPMGTLIQKLGLEAIANLIYGLTVNKGDFLNTPVVEVVRVFGASLAQTVLGGHFLTSARRDNSELYRKAQAELLAANSLLLSSNVIHTTRKDNSVELVVQTPQGIKYICAKKLLMAIPPRVEALKAFDLRQNEKDVFNKLLSTGYYSALLNNTGIPNNLTALNTAPDQPYGIPALPSNILVGASTIPGLATVFFGTPASRSTYPYSDDYVKNQMISTVKRLQAANPTTFKQSNPDFYYYVAHAPYSMQARAEDIKAGIYQQMYALQGQGSCFWTGAAWRAEDSSNIWRYNNEVVLPALLKSLK